MAGAAAVGSPAGGVAACLGLRQRRTVVGIRTGSGRACVRGLSRLRHHSWLSGVGPLYVLYNGKFPQADRDGVRGKLLNQEWVEINLSFDATVPVRNDRERSGMPDLKPTVQMGPSVNLHLFRSEDAKVKLDLRMPVEAALSVQASPHLVGWTFTPKLNLDLADPIGIPLSNIGTLVGPQFADHRYHHYLYSVDAQYATPSRPEYHATAGYARNAIRDGDPTKRFPKFWVGAYMRYDVLSGAAFEDSPLVQRRSYWAGGIGFAWILHRSSVIVSVPD